MVRREKEDVFIDLLYIYGCTSIHASGHWFPGRMIVPKFSLSVSKLTNPFPLTFVFRCLLKEREKKKTK